MSAGPVSGKEASARTPKSTRSATPDDVPIDGLVTKSDDLTLKDWAECRTTIDRFDNLQEDLRKYGFSLVTFLITAAALFGRSAPSPTAIGAAFGAAMLLVAALFFLDTYYEVLLSGAVERALDIEVRTDPHVRVTRTVSKNSASTDAVVLVLVLYVAFLSADFLLGLVNVAPTGWTATSPLLVMFIVLLPSMLVYWRFAALKCHFYRQKPRPWPEDSAGAAPKPSAGAFATSVYRVMRLEP